MTKTAFTFKKWYWGDESPPHWWTNFTNAKDSAALFAELKPFAKVRVKSNGHYRVVFNSPKSLTFFMLKWS